MFEKFLALVERIADALEVIAAAKTGNDAPRVAPTETKTDTAKDDKAAKAAEAKAAKEKKAAEAKAAAEKAAAEKAAKEAAADPLGDDPLGGGDAPAKEYTDKEVKELLAKVIDQDGRTAAFAILKDKGGGAKSFTELKKEFYEDVYVACKDKLG